MHRKFFAIGLALSFAITGALLGWQQLKLNIERREAEEPDPVEIAKEDDASKLPTGPVYSPVDAGEDAVPGATPGVSVTNPEAAAPSIDDRIAAIRDAAEAGNKATDEAPAGDSVVPPKKRRYEFSQVDRSYFEDALFIGDSRTIGIKEYGAFKEPTYFASTGLSTFSLYSKELEVNKGIGSISFEDLITEHQFGKVYIMLGINEAGSKLSEFTEKLDEIVDDISKKQPDAILFLMANLHVTKYKSQTDKTFANSHIDEINASIEQIAEKYGGYYIDANPLFDDGEGNLSKDYASDYAHLKGRCYPGWIDFICTKGIVPDIKNGETAM